MDFLVFFIMILLAFMTWAVSKIVQRFEKSEEEEKSGKD